MSEWRNAQYGVTDGFGVFLGGNNMNRHGIL